jgi:hypothetical protein
MSLWDQFELFTASEAASLVIPNNELELKALLKKMRESYDKAIGEVFAKHFEIAYPDSQSRPQKNRYHSVNDPLPEIFFYSRALDMQSRMLFSPAPSNISSKLFQDWYDNDTDKHYAFSSNFDVQQFDRKELHRWLTFHGIESSYTFERVDSSNTANSTIPEPLDATVLATPKQLLKAFDQWGLKKNWFDSPSKQTWLFAARKQIGIGGNSPTPPLYCPLEVMIGLATKIRRGNGAHPRISEEKGWRILKSHFPATYDKFQSFEVVDDQS